MNKQKIISIAVVLTVYFIGLVSGSLLSRSRIKHFHRFAKNRGKITKTIENRLMNRLTSKLQLTDEQKNKVKSIINESRPEMKKLRKTINDETNSLKDRVNQNIRKVLNEEQSVKFDKILKRHKMSHRKNGKIRKGIRRQGMRLNHEKPACIEP